MWLPDYSDAKEYLYYTSVNPRLRKVVHTKLFIQCSYKIQLTLIWCFFIILLQSPLRNTPTKFQVSRTSRLSCALSISQGSFVFELFSIQKVWLTKLRPRGAVEVERQVAFLLVLCVVVEHHAVGAQLFYDLTISVNVIQYWSVNELSKKIAKYMKVNDDRTPF